MKLLNSDDFHGTDELQSYINAIQKIKNAENSTSSVLFNTLQAEDYAKDLMNHMGLSVAIEGEAAQTVKLTSKKLQQLALDIRDELPDVFAGINQDLKELEQSTENIGFRRTIKSISPRLRMPSVTDIPLTIWLPGRAMT